VRKVLDEIADGEIGRIALSAVAELLAEPECFGVGHVERLYRVAETGERWTSARSCDEHTNTIRLNAVECVANRDEQLEDFLGLSRLVTLVVGPEDASAAGIDHDGFHRCRSHIEADDELRRGHGGWAESHVRPRAVKAPRSRVKTRQKCPAITRARLVGPSQNLVAQNYRWWLGSCPGDVERPVAYNRLA
jgi:hypothetical protein